MGESDKILLSMGGVLGGDDDERWKKQGARILLWRAPISSFVLVSVTFCVLVLHAIYVTCAVNGDKVVHSGNKMQLISFPSRKLYSTRDSSNKHHYYITSTNVTSSLHSLTAASSLSSSSVDETVATEIAPASWPELFIFRRTKKTGSSSMMNALMDALQPLGYYAMPHMPDEMDAFIRNEFRRPRPRRLMVLHHNSVTRNVHPRRAALIADTLRDGYSHVTSYCRYMRKVKNCGEAMVRCLRCNTTQLQNTYRWAFRQREDSDTYIDLPLSSAHPALSTKVLRSVFPNITLRVQRFNVKGTACNDRDVVLRAVYNQLYQQLDAQVDVLKRRLLVIAGYSYSTRKSIEKGVSLDDILDAAERIESRNYDIPDEVSEPKEKSKQVRHLLSLLTKWKRKKNGTLFLTRRRFS